MNSLRGISRAPNFMRWPVFIWQSIMLKRHDLSVSTSFTKATFEASLLLVNIDSPKNIPPRATP
jgi:hypothetical protein